MGTIKFVMTDTGEQVTALCKKALEAKGVTVTVCEKNGARALETLLNVHPQAVLLDAFMPDLDAITVKQRYEAQDTSGQHTAFFVTGAFQSEEIEQDLLDNGFSFFFVKPFDESVLVSRVMKSAGNSSRPQPLSFLGQRNWNLTGSFGTRVDRRLAPRTCEGGVPALAQGRGEYEFPKASNN